MSNEPHIIDLTTPDKLDAFGKQLAIAAKDTAPVDLKQVAMRAEMKRLRSELQYQQAKDTYDADDYKNEKILHKQIEIANKLYDAAYNDGWRTWQS